MQALDEDHEEGSKDCLQLLDQGTLTEILAQYLRHRRKATPQAFNLPITSAAGKSMKVQGQSWRAKLARLEFHSSTAIVEQDSEL